MLDFVYGLLDEQETGELQAHLAECPACRAELAKAEGSKDRLSRAALAIRDVAPFQPPVETVPSTIVPALAPAVAPLQTPTAAAPVAPSKRGLAWTLSWSVAGIALASLIGFGIFLFQDQQTQVAQRQADVAQAKQQIAEVDAEFAKVKERFESDARSTAKKASTQFQQVEVAGAGPYSYADGQTLDVSVRNAAGEKESARVQMKTLDKNTNRVLNEQIALVKGDAKMKIPPHLDGKSLRVVVEAQTLGANKSIRVEENLAVAPSNYVAHLAANKATYLPSEVLFFRVLVLQRYSLKPPEKPIPIRVGLLDGNGNRVLDRVVASGEGGIAAGELSLLPSLAGGAYMLEITGDGPENDVVAVRRAIELVRDNDDLRFALNNRALRAGSNSLDFELTQNGQPVPKQDVRVRVQTYQQPFGNQNNGKELKELEQLRIEGRGQTNSSGLAQVPVQLPKYMDADKAIVEIEVELKDGKERRRMTQEIRVIPTKLEVDLFPEGGELVAGMPNRVYWRVRTPHGETVRPEGHVIVLDSKSVIYDSERAQAVGRFEFVPDPNEKYSVRLTSSQETTEYKDVFASMPIRKEGVQLRVSDSVTAVGDTLSIDLNVRGSAKNLLVAAVCRGRPVEQVRIAAKPGSNKAKLQLATPGVHRITVFELSPAGDRPVAERLVYRLPSRSLTVKAETGTGQAAAGQKASLHLNVVDESKHAARGWGLASVVDERYLADGAEYGLGTHFLLLNEVRGGDDIEEAVMLPTADSDTSRQAIDLFLGTAGWRRFVEQKKTAEEAKYAHADPMFFRQANESLAKVRKQFQAAVVSQTQKLEDEANRERARLSVQRSEAEALLQRASESLAAIRTRPAEWGRIAQAGAAVAFLLIGVLGICFGVVATLRQRPAGLSYGLAFGGLAACMALLVLKPEDVNDTTDRAERMAGAAYPRLNIAKPEEMQREALQGPENFQVVIASETIQDRRTERAEGAVAKAGKQEAQDRQAAGRRDMAAALRGNSVVSNNYDAALPARGKAADELQRRYAENAQKQNVGRLATGAGNGGKKKTIGETSAADKDHAKNDGKGAVANSDPKLAEAHTEKDAKDGRTGFAREYAYRRQSGVEYQDTLLWHPYLAIIDGAGHATFDLPNVPANYRVLIQAHDAEGRFGMYEGRLEVKAGRK
ncbi:MAG: zf-HC2 domain-containing protein [Gemmataceae bacterium]|nr:zf-HC2 domain-containing protein [Gemmataceae bacterium]